MRSDACREWRAALGAAALEHLDAGEQVALQAHLDGCAGCRAELRELRAVAAALPLADVDRLAGEQREPSRALGDQVLARLAGARGGARRRRLGRLLAAAAAAAVVFVAAAGIAVLTREDGRDTVEVALAGTEASATVELRESAAGTEVRLVASGLDDGDWYWLWVTDANGRRVPAGTFRGTGGELDVTMTAALTLDDTRRVWVTDADDGVVLDARL